MSVHQRLGLCSVPDAISYLTEARGGAGAGIREASDVRASQDPQWAAEVCLTCSDRGQTPADPMLPRGRLESDQGSDRATRPSRGIKTRVNHP